MCKRVCLCVCLQDVQAEAPYHLLHLKVEVERSRLTSSLQECRGELARQNKALPSAGSERLVKEHRVSVGLGGQEPRPGGVLRFPKLLGPS